MGSEVSGTGSGVLASLLIEHQRQEIREGKAARAASHEVAMASKKIGMVYDKLADKERELEKTMHTVNQVVAAVNVGKAVKDAPSSYRQEKAIEALPTQEQRDAARRQIEAEQEDRAKKMTLAEYFKANPEKAIEIVDKFSQNICQRDDQTAKMWSEGMKKLEEGQLRISDKARDLNEKDHENLNEMYKAGAAFTRAG